MPDCGTRHRSADPQTRILFVDPNPRDPESRGGVVNAIAPTDRSDAEGLRLALFSGNYNYTRDGANQALNRLVAHLEAAGAAVRVYSPTTRTPAFAHVGDLVSAPSFAVPGRREYRIALGMPQ